MLGPESAYLLTLVEPRAIGVMRMRDEKGMDDKIVAVARVARPCASLRHQRALTDFRRDGFQISPHLWQRQ